MLRYATEICVELLLKLRQALFTKDLNTDITLVFMCSSDAHYISITKYDQESFSGILMSIRC